MRPRPSALSSTSRARAAAPRIKIEKLDDLLITGPTNTNVMDVHIVLVGARP
jgi:hypothetical protein